MKRMLFFSCSDRYFRYFSKGLYRCFHTTVERLYMVLLNVSACLNLFIHPLWDAAVPHLWWENKEILLKSCSSIVAQRCCFWGLWGFRWVLFLLFRFQALVLLPHAINFAQDCNLCAVFSTTVNINNLIEKRIKML